MRSESEGAREPRVIGIDPGLNRTGYGVVSGRGASVAVVEAGIIVPGRRDQPLEARLERLYDSVAAVLRDFEPAALALEEVFSHRRFPVAALWMAHARGVLCLAAGKHGIPVFSYAPSTVKLALTGQGRAAKEQVQHMVALRLGLPRPPSPSDVADALALALTHLDGSTGARVEVQGRPGDTQLSLSPRRSP